MDVYKKIKELGYELPEAAPKGGVYKPVVQVGNLLYISGQGATKHGKPIITGKVGAEVSLEQGQMAARVCALNALSAIDAYLGDLNKVKRLIKTNGFVASAPGFNSQPAVVNGASEFLAVVFGEENGIGARTAMSTNELPGNIPVEIEFIFEMK